MLVQGQREKATQIVEEIARVNGRPMPLEPLAAADAAAADAPKMGLMQVCETLQLPHACYAVIHWFTNELAAMQVLTECR